jgi:Dynamin family
MEELLADLREAQRKLRLRGDCSPGVIEHANALARLEALIAARPRVVLIGEVNAGKTSLANRLLGQAVLPAGAVANTRWPVILHYAETISVAGITRDARIDLTLGDGEMDHAPGLQRLEVGMPSPRLADFDLVDTPGLSPATRFDGFECRAGDLLLWCTLATQAWKESERRLWMSLPGRYRRDAILVATHEDCLRSDDDVRKVRARLAVEAAGCFRSIALVGAGRSERTGRRERRDDEREDDGVARLVERIAESLAAMSGRRASCGYLAANRIIRKALTLLQPARPVATSPTDGSISRLLLRYRPTSWPSIGRPNIRSSDRRTAIPPYRAGTSRRR